MLGQTLALSFQSVAELWGWAESRRWGERERRGLELFVAKFLIIPYDLELAKVWARVMEESRRVGRRFEAGDCWIVATAVHRKIPLLTNDRDMTGYAILDLQVVSYVDDNAASGVR